MTALPLTDPERAGLYALPADRQAAIATAARDAGFRILHASLDASADADQALTTLGTQLEFPDWYGANFDALYDCLTDPDWNPAAGHLLLLSGLGRWQQAHPEAGATLIEVLLAACDERRAAGHPFWLLVDQPGAGIPPLA